MDKEERKQWLLENIGEFDDVTSDIAADLYFELHPEYTIDHPPSPQLVKEFIKERVEFEEDIKQKIMSENECYGDENEIDQGPWLERELQIGKDWERFSVHYPEEQFVRYDPEDGPEWSPEKFPESTSYRYPSMAIYLIDGVKKRVWQIPYFYEIAVKTPKEVDHVVIANAIELYMRKEKQEGYCDVQVILCEEEGTQEDVNKICEKYGYLLKGNMRSMHVDCGRIVLSGK